MTVLPRQQIRRLVRAGTSHTQRRQGLRLDKNERCLGYPARVVRAMFRGLSGDELSSYPDPVSLYEKIAASHKVRRDQVAITAGSELAIRYLFEAFLAAGDEVVMLNPSFAMFEVYARLYGGEPVGVDFEKGWQVDPEELLRRITNRTKIVAIANPNNPTGTVLAEQVLLAVIERAAAKRALVLVDEAYYHFHKRTMLPNLPKFANLVVTRTFSKACGVAGVRLGYAVGHRRVIEALQKVQPIDHVNVLAVRAGEYLLDHPDLIEDYVDQVEAGKRYLLRSFHTLGIPARGSAANFVLADLGPRKDSMVRALHKQDIYVGASLKLPFADGYVRVTAGPVTVMRQFIDTLQAILPRTRWRAGGGDLASRSPVRERQQGSS